MKRREWLKALVAAPLAAVVPQSKPVDSPRVTATLFSHDSEAFAAMQKEIEDRITIHIKDGTLIQESQFSDAVVRALRNAEKMGRFNTQKMGRFIP